MCQYTTRGIVEEDDGYRRKKKKTKKWKMRKKKTNQGYLCIRITFLRVTNLQQPVLYEHYEVVCASCCKSPIHIHCSKSEHNHLNLAGERKRERESTTKNSNAPAIAHYSCKLSFISHSHRFEQNPSLFVLHRYSLFVCRIF